MEERWGWGSRGIYLVRAIVAAAVTSFASAPPSEPLSQESEKRKSGFVLSQAQLQDELLRYEGRFTTQVNDAISDLAASNDPKIRAAALLFFLRSAAGALDIVVSPVPESNLLDMVAFVELTLETVRDHWVPCVFKESGKKLEVALEQTRQDVWQLAARILAPEQQEQLRTAIHDWRASHPQQVAIATLRLSAFASAPDVMEAGDRKAVTKLLSSVKGAVQATDAARLFAERALYYAQREPFLLRLQARLTAHELINDASVELAGLSKLGDMDRRLNDLLAELRKSLTEGRLTLTDATGTLSAVQGLMAQFERSPTAPAIAGDLIRQLSELAREWNRIATLAAANPEPVASITSLATQAENEADRLLKRGFLYGAALIGLASLGVVGSKLTVTRIDRGRGRAA
jgi:hypothetical protein